TQSLIGGIEEPHRARLFINLHTDVGGHQGNRLDTLLPFYFHFFRARNYGETFVRRKLGAIRKSDADDFRRPELNSKGAAVHCELSTARKFLWVRDRAFRHIEGERQQKPQHQTQPFLCHVIFQFFEVIVSGSFSLISSEARPIRTSYSPDSTSYCFCSRSQ